jgi:hypothetical protein
MLATLTKKSIYYICVTKLRYVVKYTVTSIYSYDIKQIDNLKCTYHQSDRIIICMFYAYRRRLSLVIDELDGLLSS